MVTITIADAQAREKSTCLAFLVEQDFSVTEQLKDIITSHVPFLEAALQQADFTGKEKSVCAIPLAHHASVQTIIVMGLGKKNKHGLFAIETVRRALGTLTKMMQARHLPSTVLHLPNAAMYGVSAEYLGKQIAIIMDMASYRFDRFFTEKPKMIKDFSVAVVVDAAEHQAFLQGVAAGSIIAQAINKVRLWIDLPAKYLNPLELADKAQEIAQTYKMPITIFDEKKVIELGMGGLAAVSAGSEIDCRFVVMEYKTTHANAPTIAFVGKGITFDSGGLSLKPAAYMETMKEDMSGAAAVIGAMQVLAQLKPAVNIVAITPLSENMPSGTATKPGDIVTFYNGKTAEIRNTDAEGRLILADALSYAVKNYKLDAIIDLATLTGACVHALGPFFSGMMSQHDDFVAKVQEAADLSGDRVWRLPLDNDYKVAIKSDVADICNQGSSKYKAGTITAGFFLQHFVGDVPWVHLDIAGTAFDVPDISYYGTGATGYGVRLLVELAMHW